MGLTWRNVTVEVKNTNRDINKERVNLLEDISGSASEGQLIAFMGQSGSGKTTLLNVLAGRVPTGSRCSGEILLDKKQRKKNTWLKFIGFVEQNEAPWRELTVYEILLYSSKFRLKDVPISEIKNRIEVLMKKFGLRKIKNTLAKKISGGELKRVFIALELITSPRILFLDEPTSGLDSGTSLDIIKYLHKLAHEDKICVIFSIHQPSFEVFKLVDSVYLLNEGFLIYSGPPAECEDFFNSFGIERRANSSVPEMMIETTKKEEEYEEVSKNDNLLKKMIIKNKNQFDIEKGDIPFRKAEDTASYSKYGINIYHIWLLILRRWSICYKNPTKFLILTGFRFFSLGLLIFSFSTNLKQGFEGIKKSIEDNKNFLNSDNFDISKIADFNFDHLKNAIHFIHYNTPIMALISLITVFADENVLISREIRVAAYSITSYFLSVLLFEIIQSLILFVLTYYIGIFFSDVILHIILLEYFICIPILSLFYIFLFASFSKDKKVVSILCSIPFTIMLLSPQFLKTIEPYAGKAICSTLSYLCIFNFLSPGYFMTFILNEKSFNVFFDELALSLPNVKKSVFDVFKASYSRYPVFLDYVLENKHLYLSIFASSVFCTVTTLLLLRRILLPSIKLKLNQ